MDLPRLGSGKLLIVALDGLDYALTRRWRVEKLLQQFNGEFYVGNLRALYTPLIWSSVLCGFNVEERGYGYEEAVRRSMGVVGALRGVKRKLLGEKRPWILRKLLVRLGLLKANFVMPRRLLRETFLEIARRRGFRVFALEVPSYNEATNGAYRLKMHELVLSKSLGGKIKFIERVKRDSLRRLEGASAALRSFDLVMCYLPLPDLAHHLFFKGIKDRLRVHGIYKWLEREIAERLLKPAYEFGFRVLILSDHGFDLRNYSHSNFAFWSSNTELPKKIETYRDVKPCVLDMLSA